MSLEFKIILSGTFTISLGCQHFNQLLGLLIGLSSLTTCEQEFTALQIHEFFSEEFSFG